MIETHTSFIVTAPGEAVGPAVPIEAYQSGVVEDINLPEDRDWQPAAGWPHDIRRSGDEWNSSYYDADENLIKPRPELPGLPTEGPAPLTLDLSPLPEGTTLTLTNEAGDAMTLSLPLTEPLTLTDPGAYRARIAPPFPWLPSTQEITVA